MMELNIFKDVFLSQNFLFDPHRGFRFINTIFENLVIIRKIVDFGSMMSFAIILYERAAFCTWLRKKKICFICYIDDIVKKNLAKNFKSIISLFNRVKFIFFKNTAIKSIVVKKSSEWWKSCHFFSVHTLLVITLNRSLCILGICVRKIK